jgi:uncharacterized protein YukE
VTAPAYTLPGLPAGDPAALQECAAALEGCADSFRDLGASTFSVTADIRDRAHWTGDAAKAYSSGVVLMDERAEAVQRLIDASAQGPLTLTVLSGLDLCVLGATGQSLFDTAVTVAWDRQSGEVHEAVSADVMAGLVRRELLEPTTEPGAYRIVAELSIATAARTVPTFGACHGGRRRRCSHSEDVRLGDEDHRNGVELDVAEVAQVVGGMITAVTAP